MSYTYVHFSEVDKVLPADDSDPMFPSAARVLSYIKALHSRHEEHLVLNTAVEKTEKRDSEWVLTLRRSGPETDYWYQESFDAVVVATGIYSVPKIPSIKGLVEYNWAFPGRALHSKYFRSTRPYKNKVWSSTLVMDRKLTSIDRPRYWKWDHGIGSHPRSDARGFNPHSFPSHAKLDVSNLIAERPWHICAVRSAKH